jgi:hypothetical protein
MEGLGFVRVISGVTYEYLKDINLFGRVTEEEDFVLFGCAVEDEPKFYQGIYEMDQMDEVFGFESADEVKEFWEDGGDGCLLHIEKGCFEIVEQPSCGKE